MQTERFQLFPVDGPQIVPIIGAPFGSHQIRISFSTPPTFGTVTAAYRQPGQADLIPLAKVDAVDITSGEVQFRIDGWLSQVVIMFDGLVGGSSPEMWVSSSDFPLGLFTGDAAMAVQFYPELNIKRGRQFYLRAAWPLADRITANTSRLLHFTTGPTPVIVKLRDFSYIAEELVIRLWVGPTGVTGGDALEISNYNGINPDYSAALGITATKNVAVTDKGVEFGGSDPEYYFGSSSAGGRTQASIPQGRERVLPPNTEFIVEIENSASGSTPARAQYYIDFYVGQPDVPL